MQQKKCKKCGILNPIANMQCFQCRESLALVGIYNPTLERENLEQKIYVECLVCGTKKYLKNKNEIIRRCECCGDDQIHNYTLDDIRYEGTAMEPQHDKNKELIEDNFLNSKTVQNTRKELNKEEAGIRKVELRNLGDGKILCFDRGEYMLGAYGDIEADYFYPLRYVGRKHAIIFIEEKQVCLLDNNSTNHTYINEKMVKSSDGKIEIISGDVIRLADQRFEVKICK